MLKKILENFFRKNPQVEKIVLSESIVSYTPLFTPYIDLSLKFLNSEGNIIRYDELGMSSMEYQYLNDLVLKNYDPKVNYNDGKKEYINQKYEILVY